MEIKKEPQTTCFSRFLVANLPKKELLGALYSLPNNYELVVEISFRSILISELELAN
jgi:hypothetical protein